MTDAVRIVPRERVDRLGEGVVWSAREQAVYWVDILARRLSRLTVATGEITDWVLPEMIGWVVERRDRPGLIAGLASGIKAVTLDPLTVVPFADLPGEPAGNRMNDAAVDDAGRLWAGTMPIDGDRPSGSFYRIDADASVDRVDGGYTVANGPAFSPDGRWLYHTDSAPGRVYRFARHADGTLGVRVLWLQFAEDWGRPDGMTCDADGGVWIAHWGGGRVSRFTPDAALDRSIALPASQITNISFAGDELDRMFVTSAGDGVDEEHAGALFEVRPGCRGVAPVLFAG